MGGGGWGRVLVLPPRGGGGVGGAEGEASVLLAGHVHAVVGLYAHPEMGRVKRVEISPAHGKGTYRRVVKLLPLNLDLHMTTLPRR